MSELLYEKDGPIATLTLNRPDRLNAISGPMLAALSERLIEANGDRDVRAIIITGAGRGFCAGLDLQDATSGSRDRRRGRRRCPRRSTCARRRRRCSTRSTSR